MLSTEVPNIITPILPGPKSAAVIAARERETPKAIRCVYPVVMKRHKGPSLKTSMETVSSTGLAASAS